MLRNYGFKRQFGGERLLNSPNHRHRAPVLAVCIGCWNVDRSCLKLSRRGEKPMIRPAGPNFEMNRLATLRAAAVIAGPVAVGVDAKVYVTADEVHADVTVSIGRIAAGWVVAGRKSAGRAIGRCWIAGEIEIPSFFFAQRLLSIMGRFRQSLLRRLTIDHPRSRKSTAR